MMMNHWWGVIFLAVVFPLIGGLPLTAWIVRSLTGQKLTDLGTRNVGVSAAFYHGGTNVGILCVLAEAAKGIGAVWGARQFFPTNPTWELAALIALVIGRYWIGRGAGTTNVVWGVLTYNWLVTLWLFLISGGITAFSKDRKQGRWVVLILLPLTIALVRQDLSETGMAIALSFLLAWIYTHLPDDLKLPSQQAQANSQGVFQFLQHNPLVSLDQHWTAHKVGQKAATLSQLKRWGYAVPTGWVLLPGEDAEPLIKALAPTSENSLVVRSSAIGEDSDWASAAGQYQSFLHITSRNKLRRAIADCRACYDNPAASQYRQDKGVPEGGMAVIIQEQILGQFSGVAFSRDPTSGDGDRVAIEALPGQATQVVSGRVTPERYVVQIPAQSSEPLTLSHLTVTGPEGQLPKDLIAQVAWLVRELEGRYHGIPQDLEWTFDGETLWVLQTRSITTLQPIWTRRIAAEVIPGVIRPLTWSINQPLTCGVWADLFRQVLGKRVAGFQARELATLHYGRAYFNATVLGQTFLRMGLPPESLEFLTRGAKMGRPSKMAMVKTLPGLLRLLLQEWTLPQTFRWDNREHFQPLLQAIAQSPASQLTPQAGLERVDAILTVLKRATLFSILAPLSAALRQKLYQVADEDLDGSVLPETAALRSLHQIADRHPEAIAAHQESTQLTPDSMAMEHPPNHPRFNALHQDIDAFLVRYGYLSDVGTDIAIPTWRENPEPIWRLITQWNPTAQTSYSEPRQHQKWKVRKVQHRVQLKGQVAEVYSRLLAELRYTLLALEHHGLVQGVFHNPGDIFFLTLSELREWINQSTESYRAKLSQHIQKRRHEFDLAQTLEGVPSVVYGTPPPLSAIQKPIAVAAGTYMGIGASPGIVEGTVQVMRSLRQIPPKLSRQTILVVPYTDAGWSPVLSQVGAIVAEVGGRLSHGAIIAREYGIPAVMDISQATQRFQNGQRVRVDGDRGMVEIIAPD